MTVPRRYFLGAIKRRGSDRLQLMTGKRLTISVLIPPSSFPQAPSPPTGSRAGRRNTHPPPSRPPTIPPLRLQPCIPTPTPTSLPCSPHGPAPQPTHRRRPTTTSPSDPAFVSGDQYENPPTHRPSTRTTFSSFNPLRLQRSAGTSQPKTKTTAEPRCYIRRPPSTMTTLPCARDGGRHLKIASHGKVRHQRTAQAANPIFPITRPHAFHTTSEDAQVSADAAVASQTPHRCALHSGWRRSPQPCRSSHPISSVFSPDARGHPGRLTHRSAPRHAGVVEC
ncbi:hypothetical protein BJ912DRAFT_87208 [Pholiota molesta]|nr:hypothetical protein BJ912DRAFT_87208 [Pholiota molesta]